MKILYKSIVYKHDDEYKAVPKNPSITYSFTRHICGLTVEVVCPFDIFEKIH